MPRVPISYDRLPATLLDQVRQLLENYADQTAITLVDTDGATSFTYHTLFTEAARYAQALESIGVRPKDLVVLVLQQGESVVYGFWGAMLLGAVPSIFPFLTDKLDQNRYFDSVRQLIEHSGVRVVITNNVFESSLRDHLENIPTLAGIVNVDTLEPGGGPTDYLYRQFPAADDIAFLQHSSGSTGLQKGVMLSHRAVIHQIANYSEAIQLAPDDVVVSWLPLYHDMGLIAAFVLPIMQAIPLVLMSPFQWVREPQILLHAITRYRGTLCWLPNFAYSFLATRIRDTALQGVDLSSIRALINCSEPVYAESHRLFAKRFAPYGFREDMLTTCYAMAENTFAVTQSALGAVPKIDYVNRRQLMEARIAEPIAVESELPGIENVSCGHAIPQCMVRIVDDQRQKLPERQIGEVALHSDSMLTGYYLRPELSVQAIDAEWYFTGDMGYLADGELYITGRKKDLIIVGGKNVYPQDIENLLNEISGIHAGRVVAFGIQNPNLGTEDVVVLAEVDHEDFLEGEPRGEIVRTIRTRVAQTTDVTARYVILVPPKWLIKTSSGKIARAANREKYLQEWVKDS